MPGFYTWATSLAVFILIFWTCFIVRKTQVCVFLTILGAVCEINWFYQMAAIWQRVNIFFQGVWILSKPTERVEPPTSRVPVPVTSSLSVLSFLALKPHVVKGDLNRQPPSPQSAPPSPWVICLSGTMFLDTVENMIWTRPCIIFGHRLLGVQHMQTAGYFLRSPSRHGVKIPRTFLSAR